MMWKARSGSLSSKLVGSNADHVDEAFPETKANCDGKRIATPNMQHRARRVWLAREQADKSVLLIPSEGFRTMFRMKDHSNNGGLENTGDVDEGADRPYRATSADAA